MLRVSAQALAGDATPITAEIPVSAADVAFDLTVPSPQLWSPDTPSLYRVDVTLSQGDKVLDAQSERIGFVKLSSKGKHFLINDEPYYMRGSGDFISCPETGCPDTDRERWRRKLKALRDYGYNYVRCQSYVYPPEYFDAADEAGVLIQSEMGMLGAWAGLDKWHVHQWPKPTADNYPILKRQWDLIVQRDVNHPSANLYCMSNEYNADCFHFPRIAWECYHATKAVKPTAFVIWTDGGYSEELPGEFINHAPDYEIDGEDGTKRYLFDIVDKPFIQHEFRWWSSFPDVRSMHKYSGAIRPYAADIAVEAAARQGLSHILPDAADMSQRLQLLEAKVKMEVCRRDHASMAGICHFDAMDANLSPQGVINEFYDRKLADSATWQQTNGDTVIISGLDISDRIRIAGESFTCALSVSDFAHPPMQTPTVAWRLLIGKEVAASGEIIYAHEPYTTCAAGEIKCEVPELSVFARATLEATLRDGDRIVTNSWDLWITPAATSLPHSVAVYGAPKYCAWLKNIAGLPTVTAADLTDGECSVAAVLAEVLDDALVQYMRAGGRVILAATEGMLRPHPPNHGYVNYFFTPPANYPPYEDGQNGTIIRNHPILDSLPHEGFADLQFFRMMDEAPPLDLKPFGLDKADPIIRVIHRYPVCRPLAYLLERDYGKGGLIISALNLDQNLPEAQWLLASMCEYSAGDEFNPAEKLSQESLISLKAATALL